MADMMDFSNGLKSKHKEDEEYVVGGKKVRHHMEKHMATEYLILS